MYHFTFENRVKFGEMTDMIINKNLKFNWKQTD